MNRANTIYRDIVDHLVLDRTITHHMKQNIRRTASAGISAAFTASFEASVSPSSPVVFASSGSDSDTSSKTTAAARAAPQGSPLAGSEGKGRGKGGSLDSKSVLDTIQGAMEEGNTTQVEASIGAADSEGMVSTATCFGGDEEDDSECSALHPARPPSRLSSNDSLSHKAVSRSPSLEEPVSDALLFSAEEEIAAVFEGDEIGGVCMIMNRTVSV